MITIILLIAALGIISIVLNIKLKKSHEIKWNILQAQQASLNSLYIAKDMLKNHCLEQNCINTSGCPFWSDHPKIRVTNKDGTPNKLWWNTNAYSIPGSNHNEKFIIIKKPNNVYKIMSFAENLCGTQSIISTGYVLSVD